MRIATLALILCCVFVQAATAADEWSRFRGPNGTGISSAANLPVDFGPDKNVIWKTPLPPGHSSPVLSDKYIFVTAHAPLEDKNYRLLVICIERAT
jgi:outer membrane protein assembly factor BamB